MTNTFDRLKYSSMESLGEDSRAKKGLFLYICFRIQTFSKLNVLILILNKESLVRW